MLSSPLSLIPQTWSTEGGRAALALLKNAIRQRVIRSLQFIKHLRTMVPQISQECQTLAESHRVMEQKHREDVEARQHELALLQDEVRPRGKLMLT